MASRLIQASGALEHLSTYRRFFNSKRVCLRSIYQLFWKMSKQMRKYCLVPLPIPMSYWGSFHSAKNVALGSKSFKCNEAA